MDRSLATLLRSLQTSVSQEDAYRLLPSATALLCQLSNPLNVRLLSSQLLEHDILWPRPVRLSQIRQVFSVFYTAALRFREDKRATVAPQDVDPTRSTLAEIEWITAVVQGAEESSPRWRHALMIGALLLATVAQKDEELPYTLRQKLEAALVRSINLALENPDGADTLLTLVFILQHTFHFLTDPHKAQLNHDLLLPVLVDAVYYSPEGLEHGYWLGSIDQDVRQVGQKFSLPLRSRSGQRVQEIKSRPIVASLGATSRILGYAVDHVNDRSTILQSVERVSNFASNLAIAWRQNKLSEVDRSEEQQYLDQETLEISLPAVFAVLRDAMFSVVITLRSVLGRLLVDHQMASDNHVPALATRCLQILRNTYFISHRFGQTSTSQYLFVFLTPIDMLSQYPAAAENFLASIKPALPGQVPGHPLERLLDLFFLNTAEHFTISISAAANEALLRSSMPYVQADGDRRLGELYEAAHSVTLAVFAAPLSADIIPKYVPIYIETLMASFPSMLTARQFRLAVKSIVRIAAPPSLVSRKSPLLQAVILDLLTQRLISAPEAVLPSDPNIPVENAQPLSEKAILLLAIFDSLPHLPISLLEDWLPISADLLHKIEDPAQKDFCQKRLWEVLSNGEMDVERAALCVNWWANRGGRELVLFGEVPEDEFPSSYATMSGGLGEGNKL